MSTHSTPLPLSELDYLELQHAMNIIKRLSDKLMNTRSTDYPVFLAAVDLQTALQLCSNTERILIKNDLIERRSDCKPL